MQVPRWRRVVTPALAAVVAGASVAVALWPTAPSTAPPVTRFPLSMPAHQTLILDRQSRDLAITPDGTRVVYRAAPASIRSALRVCARPTRAAAAHGPRSPRRVRFPRLTAAGSAFSSRAVPVRRSRRSPSPVGRRCRSRDSMARVVVPRGATGSHDHRGVRCGEHRASAIPPAGGEPQHMTRPNHEQGERDHLWPHVLPGSMSVLFTITALAGGMDAAQVAVLDVGVRHLGETLIRGASQAQYVPSGRVVVLWRGAALWAVAFDLSRVETIGTGGSRRAGGRDDGQTGAAEFDIARDGTLGPTSPAVGSGDGTAHPGVGRSAAVETPITGRSSARTVNVRLSPDGKSGQRWKLTEPGSKTSGCGTLNARR